MPELGHIHLTGIIDQEAGGFVIRCPELDITTQGDTAEEAKENLGDALELFFAVASEAQIRERLDRWAGSQKLVHFELRSKGNRTGDLMADSPAMREVLID